MTKIDLEKELGKATEEVKAAPGVDDMPTPNEPSEEDFELEELEESEGLEGLDDPDEENHRITGASLKTMALRIVKAFNVVQKRTFLPLYKKRILQSGDEDVAANWLNVQETNKNFDWEQTVTKNPENYAIYKRVSKFQQLCEELPLTEDEINDIADPLAEVMEKRESLRMSPEGALALAVFLVMLPRIEPILPGLGSIFKKAKEKAEQK